MKLYQIATLALLPFVAGHGSVVRPLPRQAVDRDVAPWTGKVPEPLPAVSAPNLAGTWCPIAGGKDGKEKVGDLGQSCFWFSNGCAIGCPECDGSTRGPEVGPEKRKICGDKVMNATLCDPAKRTVNTGAACGSKEDRYLYTPWRAPGFAPVFDACGMAGGRALGPGGHGAVYRNTTHAKQGDTGKVLGPLESNTTWKAGDSVEVSWALSANHGGGYQYRLCPASEPLTEECFQKTPLPFDIERKQSFRWGGLNGKQIWYDGTYVSEGTNPPGSTWSMNPIPRNDSGSGKSFEPRCEEVPGCGDMTVESRCFCSGMWGPYDLEIIDYLKLPTDLPAGKYVLGWRWDCEESNQVWASCSDVEIAANYSE